MRRMCLVCLTAGAVVLGMVSIAVGGGFLPVLRIC
jgi:hypothetical protein